MSIGANTLVERIRTVADRRGSSSAILGMGRRLTYESLIRNAAAYAGEFANRDGPVGIVMGNEVSYPAALLGAWAASRMAVVVDPRWEVSEIVDALTPHRLGSVAVGETTPEPVARYWRQVSNLVTPQSATQYRRLPTPTASLDDPALILFTAGSTGRPKAVLHSHRSLLSGADALLRHRRSLLRRLTPPRAASMLRRFPQLPLRLWRARKQLGWMTPLGFYTISGISVVTQALISGGRISVCWPFSPAETLRVLQRDETNILAVSPTMLEALLRSRHPGEAESLLVVGVGAAAAHPALLSQAEVELGCPVVVGFGSTELGGGVLATDPWDNEREYGDVGTAIEGTEWKIVDESGRTLPLGSVGELAHRGSGTMVGYLTAFGITGVNSEGWCKTGDLGIADNGGRIRLVGRSDDLMTRGGMKIYPAEIERLVCAHPDVSDCAVVGQPTESGDFEISVFIVPRAGVSLSPDRLESWAITSIARHKRPDNFHIVEGLPRTDAGKVRKADLH